MENLEGRRRRPQWSQLQWYTPLWFQDDDPEQACEKLNDVNGEQLNSRDGFNNTMGTGPANFEMKWAGPNGVVIDISHTGWTTS